MDSAGERFEAIRAALADRNNILTVKDLCELAGVSRSGYYNWVRSEKNRELREAKDRAAFEQILEAYRFRGYAKGVRGIHMRLLHTWKTTTPSRRSPRARPWLALSSAWMTRASPSSAEATFPLLPPQVWAANRVRRYIHYDHHPAGP